MTKGTSKEDREKYDGKRRGWAKFDTKMTNGSLANELLEKLWQGADVNLPEGTAGDNGYRGDFSGVPSEGYLDWK